VQLFEKFYFAREIIFPLLNELHQNIIIPYFIIKLKYVKQIGLKLRSVSRVKAMNGMAFNPTPLHGCMASYLSKVNLLL